MDNADDHGRLSRPLRTRRVASIDRAAVLADPAKPGRSRVALADRVRGDQAEGALVAEQVERTAEEVGDEIGDCRATPRESACSQSRYDSSECSLRCSCPQERRIADERIEPRILPVEHLRKLDLPVERDDRRVSRREVHDAPPRAGC